MESWFPHTNEDLSDLTRWQMRFEEERVKIILKKFKLMSHLHDLLNECEDLYGDRRLTFEIFYREFWTFPILLTVRYQPGVAKTCRPAALFRSFEKTFLYDSYLEWFGPAQKDSHGRPIGMIVPFDGYRGGMLVHNANDTMVQRDGGSETRRLRMVYDIPGDLPPHRLTVEPFLSFLHYLAQGNWTPNSPLPEPDLTEPPQLDRGMTIYPWMANRVGTGPALVVFAWLLKVLNSSSAYDRLYVHRASEDHRYVVAKHEDIASETGLSARKVKRGLEILRREGLVVSRRCHTGSYYEVLADVCATGDVQ